MVAQKERKNIGKESVSLCIWVSKREIKGYVCVVCVCGVCGVCVWCVCVWCVCVGEQERNKGYVCVSLRERIGVHESKKKLK
jgi:hypothetical protein